MKITVLTLFPEMIETILKTSILKRAKDQGVFDLEVVNIRDFSKNKYHHVDDTPYGGGAGMLMQIEPIDLALKSVRHENSYVLMTSPKAKPFTQDKAIELSKKDHLIFLCGHYEGIDARVEKLVDENISIGDYILTGGELASCVVIDSVVRLIDHAITKESLDFESYDNNLLEYPQYTKPFDYCGDCVPELLLSGHHKNIERWRLKMSLLETFKHRKDLLKDRKFSKEEIELLKEILHDLKSEKA